MKLYNIWKAHQLMFRGLILLRFKKRWYGTCGMIPHLNDYKETREKELGFNHPISSAEVSSPELRIRLF